MKYSAAILTLILLASCATPPPPSGSNGDPSNAAWLAQGTADAAGRVLRDAEIATAAAMATAAEMNVKSTRQAQTVATMTAVPMQTVAAQQAQRASDLVNDENQIHLNAIATRQTINTNATRAAVQLAIDEETADDKRRDIFLNTSAVVFFLIIASGWVSYLRIQLFTKRTIIANNGDPIAINGREIEYEDEPAPPPTPVKRSVPFKPRTQEVQPIEMTGESFPLTEPNGRAIVYTFDHHDLHSMRLNVERGDVGFRREKSDKGVGMDELIKLTNANKYKSILSAMKANGWVESVGVGSRWTSKGLRDVLGIEPPPQQNPAI